MLRRAAALCSSRLAPMPVAPMLTAAPSLHARPAFALRSMCTAEGGSGNTEAQIAAAVMAWEQSAQSGNAPPLRFPVGTPVRCFAGNNNWVRGTVVAQWYRESSWPEQRAVPYQILLDDEYVAGRPQNAMWAPADVEEIIRSAFRFELEDKVDCRISQDEWVRCTVVGRFYREPDWEKERSAPYQVRVEGVLPGCQDEQARSIEPGVLIWVPRDVEAYIRPVSAERDERLQALAGLHKVGALSDQELQEKRKGIILA